MAVGFSASGDYAKRTANLPDIQTFTISGWVKLRDTPSAYSYFMGIEDADSSSSKFALLGYSTTNDPDDAWQFSTQNELYNWNPDPAVDTWYYFFIRSSEDIDFVEAGFCDIDDTSFQKSTQRSLGVGAFTPARISLGNDSWDEWTDCAIAYVRVWDAQLSDAELLDERDSATPVRTSGLRMDWPLANNTDTGDDSGNGYDLTFGGTLTSETSPDLGEPPAGRTTKNTDSNPLGIFAGISRRVNIP